MHWRATCRQGQQEIEPPTLKYTTIKEKVKAKLQKADFVGLTADMCTSIKMDGYLSVTCHHK